MIFRKVLIFTISLMLFSVCANAKTKKKYLALGDSITEGYTLANKEEDCFASLLAKKYDLELTNEALAGDKSSDLLEKLSNYNIDDYDVITICIGANDIFHEFTEKFYEIGLDNPQELYDAIFNDTEMDSKIDEDLKVLESNLPKIMEIIKSGHAQIYMMNVYNPYNNAIINGLDVIADKYVKKVNEVIKKYSAGTTFIDLYKSLNNSKGILNSQSFDGGKFYDPHPNIKGHKKIFAILDEAYDKNNTTTTSIILIITFGVVVVLLEVFEMIYTVKKFSFKNVNNSVDKPKIESKEEEKKDSSRFIRS